MTLTELIEATDKELIEAGKELKMQDKNSADYHYISGGIEALKDVARLLREVE